MSTHSGINYQIQRIQNLVNRLVNKLRTMSLLSSSQHTFSEAVTACRNINTSGGSPTLTPGSVTLGSAAPTTPVTPPSGYVGFSQFAFNIDPIAISPEKILQGHSIVGVGGTAIASHNPRRISWNVTVTNQQSITVSSSDFLVLPKFEELFIFRKQGGGTYEYKEFVYGIRSKNAVKDSFNNWGLYMIPGSINFANNWSTYAYSNDGHSLTITLGDGNYRFNGWYVLYYYY